MVRHAGWIFLLALGMDGARGIIKMSQLLSPVSIHLSVCSLNNTNSPMQCPSFKFQLVSFSLLIFINFHVPFVVIVNVLGYCCFSHIHCLFFFLGWGWGWGSKDNHYHFINVEWILDLFFGIINNSFPLSTAVHENKALLRSCQSHFIWTVLISWSLLHIILNHFTVQMWCFWAICGSKLEWIWIYKCSTTRTLRAAKIGVCIISSQSIS